MPPPTSVPASAIALRKRAATPTKAAHATRKRGHTSVARTTAREQALVRTVAKLAAKVESMERRFVRLGLAEQPTKRPTHAKGKQWGLPPRTGEVRLQVRGDDWSKGDLAWY